MQQQHPSTTTPDLASIVARLFGLNQPQPPHQIIHMPERRTRERMTATLVALPTQHDIDEPTTREARGALAMAAHALAALLERKTGVPTTAASVYDDLRGILTIYTSTYRSIAARVERDAAEKVD